MKFLFSFFLLLTLISGFFVIRDLIAHYRENQFWEHVQDMKQPDASPAGKQSFLLPEFQSLYKANPDIVGWIKIDGTKIDYPVMQTKQEPEYYLRRNFEKEEDILGTPFADYRCNVLENRSFNVIIYGHHTSGDSMFRWLLNYDSEAWYRNNKTITFDTIREKGTYEVVAAFYFDATNAVLLDEASNKGKAFRTQEASCTRAPADLNAKYTFYNYIELDSKEGFEAFKSGIEKQKLYKTDAAIEKEDSLITLICCAPVEFSQIEKNGRFVVVAKKVSE